MKKSICFVTSILVAAAGMSIGLGVAEADIGSPGRHQHVQLDRDDHEGKDKSGRHADGDKHNQQHNRTAQLDRHDHETNGKSGKHADRDDQDQRHNQTAQSNRHEHEGKDNNGQHVGWDKHLGQHTGDWTTHHPPASVPEPASLVLLGAGIAGIGILRRRMSRKG